MSNKPVTRRLKIYINGQEIDNTITSLRKNLVKFRAQANRATQGSEDWKKYNKAVAATEKALNHARQEQKEFRKEVQLTEGGIEEARSVLSSFGESLVAVFAAIKSGNIVAIRAAFTGLKESIKGASAAAITFIKTPIGIALTALAGVAAITRLWLNYNVAIAKTIKLTKQLTGFTGDELSQFRASVQATANTFDKDFNDVLRTTNALSKQMKISQQEALELINQGFVRGADASGDFLKKVSEYPIQFKNAGFSAQDFIDIATQEVKGGVYDDKLVDALKEADLALKEMTKTQQDALVNAFGKKFADEIAVGLKTGEVTTKEAIGRIIAESEKLGLNYQQQQQLVADVFKGAGEDAGGFAEIILQLNESFKEQNKELNDNEQATKRLQEANEDYEQALADLFDASGSGFPAMLTNLKAIGKEIFSNLLRGLKLVFTSIEQLELQAGLKGQEEAIKEISENMKLLGTTAQEEAEIQISNTSKNLKRLKKDLSELNIFQNAIGSDTALKQQIAKEEASLEELKKIAKGKSEAFVKFQKDLEAAKLIENNPENNKTDEQKQAEEQAKKKAEREKQREIDRAKRRKQAVQDAIDQFNEEQRIRDQVKASENEDKEEEERIIRKQIEFEKLREDAQKDVELKKELKRLEQLEIQAIKDEFSNQRIEKDKKEKEELAKKAAEFHKQQIEAETAFQTAKREALNAGLGTLRNILGQETALGKALFLFQKGKAISDIVRDTAASNASIVASTAAANALAVAASPLTGGQPWVGINTAQAAKSKATNLLSAGAQIATIAGTSLSGFEMGGETFAGNYNGGIDGRGGRLSILHPNEYVIPEFVRKDPEVPEIINYLEQKRRRKLGVFENGGESTKSNTDTAQQPTTTATTNTGLMLTEETAQQLIASMQNLKAKVVYTLQDTIEQEKLQQKLNATRLAAKQ